MMLPLAVDLDNTLVKTDTLLESLIYLIKHKPRRILQIPVWLLEGKAMFKQKIAEHVSLPLAILPYRPEVIDFLRQQKSTGRQIVLTTAADQKTAFTICQHLNIFDSYIASDATTNLKGKQKASALLSRFGKRGYDYLGDSWSDVPVWRNARHALLVTNSQELIRRVQKETPVIRVWRSRERSWLAAVLSGFRAHQWIKNILIFMPALAAHQLANFSVMYRASIAFIAFSLAASSIYLFNDLADLEDDRKHPQKSKRPLASGYLPIINAVFFAPVLLALSIITSLWLPSSFRYFLVSYVVLGIAYSILLKKIFLMDIVVLTVLYSLRVFAGSAAANVPLSSWFITFTAFLFTSGALAKRFVELKQLQNHNRARDSRRGYDINDLPILGTIGISSGYASVVVLSLYIASNEASVLYSEPKILWFVTLILFAWLSRSWLLAYLGRLYTDPITFIIKDPTSSALIISMLLLTVAAV